MALRETEPLTGSRSCLGAGLVVLAFALGVAEPVQAAVFGVPTNLDAAGLPTGTSVNPPGWFVLTGTAASNNDGDTVHQLRLFIEVTGTTLDVEVFDPGNSGARDLVRGGASTTTYQLLDPCTPFPLCNGAVRSQIANFGDDNATTENHLVRFTPANAGFFAPNSVSASNVSFSGLSAGLYEFRVIMTNASDDVNHFGVDIHTSKTDATPYNVFTVGESTAGLDTAMMVSVDHLTAATPTAAITDPITFFTFVNRGCTFQTSNYDMDITTFGQGSTGAIADPSGAAPPVQGNAAGVLTMSDVAVHSENVVTIENASATNLDSLDYGMYTLTNNPGTCPASVCGTASRVNFIDWRFADFRAGVPATAPWNDNPAALPRDPIDALRSYLPNAYTPVSGNANATAPAEPVLGTATRVVPGFGPNPPVAGTSTRFAITASVNNTTGAALGNVQISIGQPAGVVYVATSQGGFLDGAVAACTDGSGTNFRRCTFASVPAGQVASLNIEVDVTPPGTGLMNLTGPPAVAATLTVTGTTRSGTTATATTSVAHGYQVGDYVVVAGSNQAAYNGRFQITALPTTTSFSYTIVGAPAAGTGGTVTESCPDSTVCAHYTPTSSSAAFPRVENLGPVCNLVDNVGSGGALATRATVRGLRVSPGVVEFATGSQHETAAFNLYAAPDRTGRSGLVRLNAGPIPAAHPSSMTPVLYRVETAPLATPYLVIEEIDLRGRRHFMGPFDWTEPRLRASFDRLEARLDEAGAPSGGKVRMVPASRMGRMARRAWAHERPRRGRHAGLGIKVQTAGAGWVEVPIAQLREAGLPAQLPLWQLALSSQGVPVPFDLVAGADGSPALRFRAEALATDYTDRNVYLVTWGHGSPDMPVSLTRSGDPLPDGVTRVERNLIYVSDLAQGADPWVWDLLLGDGSTWPYDYDPEVGDFDLPGLPAEAAGDVPVTIRLVGRTAHRHTVEAFINGVPVGSVTFTGAVPALLAGHVDASVLSATGNHLSLSYSGSGGSADDAPLVYLGQLDLGFRSAAAGSVSYELDGYDSGLGGIGNAEYLIVTHPLFAEQAERIAALKQQEGLDAQVVDVERVYDHFSAGIVEPAAIQALLKQAGAGRRLRYVLLLGGDTFDPRDFSGTGAMSFVPSLLAWDGEFGRVPSENLYADLDGDGKPELAIGRLPAQTIEEAAVLVDKIARQTGALRQSAGRQLFVTDNQAPGDISFRAAAEAAAARMPAGTQVTWSDVTDGVVVAREALRQGALRGAAMVHYFGHAGPEIWADEGLLTRDEADLFSGMPESVLFTWACEAQWYQYLFGDTINEALLLLPRGGALASFGPAGITDPARQEPVRRKLYGLVLGRGLTLGEAIRQAKAEALAEDGRVRPVVEGWNLLGDPALRLDDSRPSARR